MKLFVIFDIKSAKYALPHIKQKDMCLIYSDSTKIIDIIKETKCKIYFVDGFIIHQKKLFKLSQRIKYFLSKDKRYYKFVNNFFTNTFLPFYKVKNSINTILKEFDPIEIVLINGNNKVNFIPYYFAEGEQQIKLLYNPSWYFNFHIYNHFKSKTKISILCPESTLKLNIFKFLRRFPILVIKFIIFTIKHIEWITKNNNYNLPTAPQKIVLFPVRSIAQYNSVAKLAKYYQQQNIQPVFLIYELLFNKENKLYKTLIQKNIYFYYIIPSNIVMIFKIFSEVFLKTAITYFIEKKEYKKELIIANFEKEIYKIFLFNSIHQLKTIFHSTSFALISSEMQSPEMFIEKDIAKTFNIKNINLQAQSMMHIPLPDLCYSSFFISENLVDYNFFKQYYTCVKYWGSFKYYDILEMNKTTCNDRKFTSILYFSQPHEHFNQVRILKTLAEQFQDKKIFIKLHPRDNNDYSFIHGYNNITILKSQDLHEILMDKNIGPVISRTSTTLLNALVYGKIPISVQLSQYDMNSKHFYLSKKYLQIIYNKDLPLIRSLIENNCTQLQTSIHNLYGQNSSLDIFTTWINK